MPYGITPAGFTPMRLQEIKLELETALKAVFGDINLESTSVFGQIIGVMSKVMADWWAGLEDTYLSAYPATASGVALDNVATLTGITRLAATYTEVTCQLTGTATTAVPAGSQVANTEGDLFTLDAEVIIPGEGLFIANSTGPIPAPAGTVNVIVTPVSGWENVDNINNGILGTNVETDAELRTRRELSLAITGAGTVESIRSRILNDVPNVTHCAVFENVSDATDPISGRPPHSIEVVVTGGDEQDIADMLWRIKPGGIQLYNNPSGGVTRVVVDSNGDNQNIYFTRPTVVYAHVMVDIDSYSTEETFPLDGIAQIIEAVLNYSANLSLGKDMLIQKWYIPVYSVPGLNSVTISHAITDLPDDTPAWQTVNIPITSTRIAELAETRIIINA